MPKPGNNDAVSSRTDLYDVRRILSGNGPGGSVKCRYCIVAFEADGETGRRAFPGEVEN